jgi:hypothetical protein
MNSASDFYWIANMAGRFKGRRPWDPTVPPLLKNYTLKYHIKRLNQIKYLHFDCESKIEIESVASIEHETNPTVSFYGPNTHNRHNPTIIQAVVRKFNLETDKISNVKTLKIKSLHI